MILDFFIPKSKTLQKYIEGYYFIAKDEKSNSFNYWTFPNNYFILSISQNIEIAIEESKLVVKPSLQDNIIANYVSSYAKPIEVLYESSVNELTIYFKPLGISYFIENAETLFKNKNASDFITFSDFALKTKEIFLLENRTEQIEALESYLISRLLNKPLSIMESILADVETDAGIDEIAKKYNFSRQYLHKLFLKTVGKPPIEYRKIHRFRSAVANQRETVNLTQLAHGNLFYDQSHLVKNFRQLTNTNPSTFFQKVATDKETVWLFI